MMKLSTFDIIFNIGLFVFWFRIWMGDSRDYVFNPFLTQLSNLAESLTTALKPVFLSTPERIIASVSLLFMIVFRGVIFMKTAETGSTQQLWALTLGLENFAPNLDIIQNISFSLLSFSLFLFNIWSISVLYATSRTSRGFAHSENTIFNISLPFTKIPLRIRPAVILLYGIIIIAAAELITNNTFFVNNSVFIIVLKLCILSLASFINVLLIIQHLIILLIIGSWVSMLSGSRSLMLTCKQWTDFFMGPLRNRPIIVGMFDLTPLILVFAIYWIHSFLIGLVSTLYSTL